MPGALASTLARTRVLTPARIAEIAHELRAPLGGIDAMVELLEASGLDATQKPLVAALKASLAHLRAVADEVLAGPAGTAAEVAPMRLLGDFRIEFETACRARTQSKTRHLPQGSDSGLAFALAMDPVLASQSLVEPGPLRQVLENLVDNAVRLTPSGCITLSIVPAQAGRLRFQLTDEGPGLSKADAARLIREGGAIADRPGGAGMGLSIAGRIVARHGGRLTGGPGPEGRGTSFAFDWPMANSGCGDAVRQEPASAETCLIVDDHPASRLVMRTILGAAGYACLEASGLDEALALVEEHQPAFVLTDLNMPDGGGARLIECIAALTAEPRPRLVVVSAEAVEAGHPLHARIDGAIQKPITIRGVLETLAALAPGKSVHAA